MLLAILIIIVVVVLIPLSQGLRIIQQYEIGVIFRLGKAVQGNVRGPGLTWIIPFVDRMSKVSIQERPLNIPNQQVITKDNVTLEIDAVAYFRIQDALKSLINIRQLDVAVSQLAQTTARNIVGGFDLDSVLSGTETISMQIKESVDAVTENWGVEITRVQLRKILLPEQMQRAMARQAEAERDKRAKIISAEGEQLSAAKLVEAANALSQNPVAIQLRGYQTLSEISTEKATIVVIPSQIVDSVGTFSKLTELFTSSQGTPQVPPAPTPAISE